ncbi:RacP protein [Streptomyces malaysiensis]|uniref:RacP protein n=1 Tax=Streptomyces malaysiensis TaxID=92644 RepID=A0A7X6B2F5_STRMQ|nr:RacP protein [Streptomyces malaysiensis]
MEIACCPATRRHRPLRTVRGTAGRSDLPPTGQIQRAVAQPNPLRPGLPAGHHHRTQLAAPDWTLKDSYQSCADPDELQGYEVAVVRGKLTEIRRFITGTIAPHAALQPKGRWIKHLNAQLNSVESTLDVIADFTDA